jgi:hypothetical protein
VLLISGFRQQDSFLLVLYATIHSTPSLSFSSMLARLRLVFEAGNSSQLRVRSSHKHSFNQLGIKLKSTGKQKVKVLRQRDCPIPRKVQELLSLHLCCTFTFRLLNSQRDAWTAFLRVSDELSAVLLETTTSMRCYLHHAGPFAIVPPTAIRLQKSDPDCQMPRADMRPLPHLRQLKA